MIEVGFATTDDLPELSDLWYKFAKEAAPEDNPNKGLWMSTIESYLKNDSTPYKMVVGRDDGTIISFADVFIMHQPSTDKIHGIGQHFYTHPAYRKSMVSSMVLKKLMDWGKAQGVEIIELFTDTIEDSFWLRHKFKPQTLMVRRMM